MLKAMKCQCQGSAHERGALAFCSLERMVQIMSGHNVDLKTALEIVPRTTIFTTHTPVAAGHDEFAAEHVRPYFKALEERLQTTEKEIISWGQPVGSGPDAPLSMFILGLHAGAHSATASAGCTVSVARRMWSHVWPQRPVEEIPISHVTNGIHIYFVHLLGICRSF